MTVAAAMLALLSLILAEATPATPIPANGVEAAVLDHMVVRGDVLTPADFIIVRLPVAEARTALSPRDAVGMEARRNLAAGSVVRSGDIMPRQLVRRGEPVMIRVVSGSLTITAAGRALGGGGRGDMIRVVTTATSHTLDGTVDGSGSVRIVAP